MRIKYLTLFLFVLTALSETGVVISKYLNFRTEPDLSSEKIHIYQRGKYFEILDFYHSSKWIRARANGEIGYFWRNGVERVHTNKGYVMNKDGVHFMWGPGWDYDTISNYPDTAIVDIIWFNDGKNRDFHFAQFNGSGVWFHKSSMVTKDYFEENIKKNETKPYVPDSVLLAITSHAPVIKQYERIVESNMPSIATIDSEINRILEKKELDVSFYPNIIERHIIAYLSENNSIRQRWKRVDLFTNYINRMQFVDYEEPTLEDFSYKELDSLLTSRMSITKSDRILEIEKRKKYFSCYSTRKTEENNNRLEGYINVFVKRSDLFSNPIQENVAMEEYLDFNYREPEREKQAMTTFEGEFTVKYSSYPFISEGLLFAFGFEYFRNSKKINGTKDDFNVDELYGFFKTKLGYRFYSDKKKSYSLFIGYSILHNEQKYGKSSENDRIILHDNFYHSPLIDIRYEHSFSFFNFILGCEYQYWKSRSSKFIIHPEGDVYQVGFTHNNHKIGLYMGLNYHF